MTVGFGGRAVGSAPLECLLDVDPRTGGASATIPLPAAPARNGLAPALTLAYASGGANTAFGAGWSLAGLPAIGIDTHLHVPRWGGSDGFQLAGDSLVTWRASDGAPRGGNRGGYSVAVLRSRRGGQRVRVEKWVHATTGRIHFRTIDARNVTTVFGARSDDLARIQDPDLPERTASWLPELEVDPYGNAMWFEYAQETTDGVDRTAGFERGGGPTAQRYLKRIRYGNGSPIALDDAVLAGTLPAGVRWCFQLVLDYGDHGGDVPAADPDRARAVRGDPFSSFRSGFEVRTYRLCRRIVTFHDVPELGATPTPVSAIVLSHDESPAGSTVRSVHYVGFRDGAAVAAPPIVFTYAPTAVDAAFVAAPASAGVTAGLGPQHALADARGDGLPGILTETDRAWYYKPNLGGGEFGDATVVAEKPATRPGMYALGDLDRDGDPDLSLLAGRTAGLFELAREDGTWEGFRPFAALPHVEAFGGRARWVDLNGDGRADLVIAKPEALIWFPSDGESFLPAIEVPLPPSSDPASAPATDTQLDFLFADMTGNGLPDLVRIGNGRIEYWPSLGNGRFDRSIVMADAPELAPDADFDPRRVRLIDLDGSGTTDLVYLGHGEVTTWINACGNRWLPGPRLGELPYLDNVSTVQILDFLADGSACLVWSTPLPGRPDAIEYLQLAPALRPRTLVAIEDSLGKRTELVYGSSAQHYLRDLASGRGWTTKLPSHRPVVDRRTLADAIAGTRMVQRFEYHDGYYDGGEREARGFAQVDVYDTDLVGNDGATFATPMLVRTWFHLGTPMWNHHRPVDTYAGDVAMPWLAPHEVEGSGALLPDEIEDGLRALAGQTIRREVYAVGAVDPFEVRQVGYLLRRTQPAVGDEPAAFAFATREDATWSYEQASEDPRVVHAMTIELDDHDLPIRTARIAYARRSGVVRDVAAQDRTWIAISDHRMLHVDDTARYELAIPFATLRYELLGIRPGSDGLVHRDDLRTAGVTGALASPAAHDAVVPDDPALGPRARLIDRQETFYWDDARTTALPLAQVGALTLVHHSETACFAPSLAASVFGPRVDDAGLAAAGYLLRDGLWWRTGEVHRFGPAAQFSRLIATERGDGATMSQQLDAYHLAVVAITNAAGSTVTAEIDYRVLAPWRIVDPNGTTSEVRYDALGVAVAMTSYGHVLDAPWGCDPLGAPPAPPASAADIIAAPLQYLGGAATYVWYDLDAWARDATPPVIVELAREELVHDGAGGTGGTRTQIRVSYLDGFGRTVQRKGLVDPGPAIQRDAQGAVIVDGGGAPVLAAAPIRWLATGNTVYDAKQRPGLVYEPFFTPSFGFEADALLGRLGVATLTHYDAVGRVIGRDFPNGTTTRTSHRAWTLETADPNDSVIGSAYQLLRAGLPASDPERRALEEAVPHAGTTATVFLAPSGHTAGWLARGGATAQDRRCEVVLDIDGHETTVIDPRGIHAFAYRRDMLGTVVDQHNCDAGDAQRLTDAFGRPVTTWDARGFETAHTFDHLDRPVAIHARGGDGPTPLDHVVRQWTYGDALPDPVDARRRNLYGVPAIVRDGAGESTVDHCDPVGRVCGTRQRLRSDVATEPDWRGPVALDVEVLTTTARFDALGRHVVDALPDGTERRYAYMASGALASVRVGDAVMFDGITYDAHGARLTMTLGNGVAIRSTYDAETFRLAARTAALGARVFQDLRYTYDPAGNLVRIADAAQSGPAGLIRHAAVAAQSEYAYDAHYRLRSATGRVHRALLEHDYVPGAAGTGKGTRQMSLDDGGQLEPYTRTYDYDASGNLTRIRHAGASQSWTTDMWISPTSNRALAARDLDGTPPSVPESRFDGGGNLRRLDHLRAIEWTWNGALARAVAIARPGGTDDAERYVYGGDGQRVRRITTRVVHGGQVEVIDKLYLGDTERKRISRDGIIILERWTTTIGDGAERVATIYRWTVDDLAREVDAPNTERVHYQLSTHQGASAIELDAAARVISYEEYFPFGSTAFLAGNDAREIDRKEYRYSGKECDDFTGLYYYGYRYLAPWLGRWLSPDPAGPVDDLNLYQFVLGDPVGRTDPDGRQSKPEKIATEYDDDVVVTPRGTKTEHFSGYRGQNPGTGATETHSRAEWEQIYRQWGHGGHVTFRHYVEESPAIPPPAPHADGGHQGGGGMSVEQLRRELDAMMRRDGLDPDEFHGKGEGDGEGHGKGKGKGTGSDAKGDPKAKDSTQVSKPPVDAQTKPAQPPPGTPTDPAKTGTPGKKAQHGSKDGDPEGTPDGVKGGKRNGRTGGVLGGTGTGAPVIPRPGNSNSGDQLDPQLKTPPGDLGPHAPPNDDAAKSPNGDPFGGGTATHGRAGGQGFGNHGSGTTAGGHDDSPWAGEGDSPDWARWIFRHVGRGVQAVLGTLEAAGGVLMMLTPTGVGQVGGAILIFHGMDTLISALLGEQTVTHDLSAAAARECGADPDIANLVGVAADNLIPMAAGGLGHMGAGEAHIPGSAPHPGASMLGEGHFSGETGNMGAGMKQPGEWRWIKRPMSQAYFFEQQHMWAGHAEPPVYANGGIYVKEYVITDPATGKVVKFDGASFSRRGARLTAVGEFKASHAGAIRSGNRWIARGLRTEALRQLGVADRLGVPLEWHVPAGEVENFKNVLGKRLSSRIVWKPY